MVEMEFGPRFVLFRIGPPMQLINMYGIRFSQNGIHGHFSMRLYFMLSWLS